MWSPKAYSLCKFGRENFGLMISIGWRLFGELKREGQIHFQSLEKCY